MHYPTLRREILETVCQHSGDNWAPAFAGVTALRPFLRSMAGPPRRHKYIVQKTVAQTPESTAAGGRRGFDRSYGIVSYERTGDRQVQKLSPAEFSAFVDYSSAASPFGPKGFR